MWKYEMKCYYFICQHINSAVSTFRHFLQNTGHTTCCFCAESRSLLWTCSFLRTLRTLRWFFMSGSCGRSSMKLAPKWSSPKQAGESRRPLYHHSTSAAEDMTWTGSGRWAHSTAKCQRWLIVRHTRPSNIHSDKYPEKFDNFTVFKQCLFSQLTIPAL